MKTHDIYSIAAIGVDTAVSTTWPRLVLALCALATAASVALAATILEVDADSERILSADLRVRQTNLALAEAFPSLQNNLVVMVEADDADDARDAAEALEAVLAREPERYPGVFLPGADPYYDDFGLYYLEQDELLDLYARARAVFFAPYQEDYGFVTVEAFQSRKPVLTCTDSGGARELVGDGESGFVVAPEPEPLAAALDRLMADASLAEKLGTAGHSVAASLSWEHTVRTLLQEDD